MMGILKTINQRVKDWSGILTVISWSVPLISTLIGHNWWKAISYENHPELYLATFAIAFVFSLIWVAGKTKDSIFRQAWGKLKAIGELSLNVKLDVNAEKLARKNLPILIVDDMEAAVVRKQINQFEYQNVHIMQQLPGDEQLSDYMILIVDIDGVGKKRDSDGLDFALNFKANHPLKQIVLISAYFQNMDEEKVFQAKQQLDGVFVKGESYDKVMRVILEKCVRNLGDPRYVWEKTRDVMHRQGTPIAKIALYENEYVSKVEKVFVANNKHLPCDWLRIVAQGLNTDIRETIYTLGAGELVKDLSVESK